MAYIDSRTPQDRAKSIAGVVAVHGALAYALLIGLQATGVIPTADAPLKGEIITEVPIPPPPPKPDEVMVTTMIYDHEARKHSYSLMAEAFGLKDEKK